jgi:tetratricopeptide (TPR) repeat protein
VPHHTDRPPAGEAAPPVPAAVPFTTLAARFTDRAVQLEQAGDLSLALNAWRVVAALRPEAEEPGRRVDDLAARLDTEAEQRYRDGLARLQSGGIAAARREFLLALAANPEHAAALDALKNRLEPDAVPYTVAAGDTFAGIANKRYGDLAKGALIARANDLDPGSRPTAGAVLTIPSLTPLFSKAAPAAKKPSAVDERAEPPDSAYDTEPSAITPEIPSTAAPAAVEAPKPPDPAEEQLSRAGELFRARRYEEAAAAADRLAGNPTVSARAREISGNAWFALGDAASREGRFADAIAAYKKAEPTRKDAAKAVAAVERRMKEKAEEYYSAGVRYFINQQLDEAIRSWEQTLALYPEHPKAPRDIEKARGLQQKLKDIR